MPYKITIDKTTVEEVIIPSKHTKTGQIEKAREACFISGNDDKKTYLSDEYGYTKEIKTRQIVTKEIYCQIVEDLDLNSVIVAVNKLEGNV